MGKDLRRKFQHRNSVAKDNGNVLNSQCRFGKEKAFPFPQPGNVFLNHFPGSIIQRTEFTGIIIEAQILRDFHIPGDLSQPIQNRTPGQIRPLAVIGILRQQRSAQFRQHPDQHFRLLLKLPLSGFPPLFKFGFTLLVFRRFRHRSISNYL